MNYFDTSALLKRYVDEAGSLTVRTMLGDTEPGAVSKIAYAEVYGALIRRYRARAFSRSAYSRFCREFEREWAGYLRIDLSDDVLSLARGVIQKHALRGFEGIHLSSALFLKRSLAEETLFVAADEQLLKAARSERLRTLNPEAA